MSHLDFRAKKGRTPEQYEQWIRDELVNSKKLIEQQLGISVKCVAYPFGNHNPDVRRIAMEAGYEAAFTVYGQRLTYHSPAEQLGRYAIESTKPAVFRDAMKMVGGGGVADDSGTAMHAAASMVTQPMDGETISDPNPTLKANLATFGEIDPESVEVRLSGIGPVPVKFDPATKMVEGKVAQKLHDPNYTVILSAKVKGRKIETRWSFNFTGGALSEPAAAPVHQATEPAKAVPAVAPAKGKKKQNP